MKRGAAFSTLIHGDVAAAILRQGNGSRGGLRPRRRPGADVLKEIRVCYSQFEFKEVVERLFPELVALKLFEPGLC